jgi:hypothetical protein
MSQNRSDGSNNWIWAIVTLLAAIIPVMIPRIIDNSSHKSTSKSSEIDKKPLEIAPKNPESTHKPQINNNINIYNGGSKSQVGTIVTSPHNPSNNKTSSPAPNLFNREEPIKLQDILLGTWEQQSYNSVYGWQKLGEFLVNKENGGYTITAKQGTLNPYSIKPLYIREVMYNGNIWTFNSYLQNGLISNFKLNRIADNHFEGIAYSSAGGYQKDRWIKIE